MGEEADKNLERLQTAFPGMVWTASGVPGGGYAGAACSTLATPYPPWVIFVDHDLGGWSLASRHVLKASAHSAALGHAPLAGLGRVIAAEAKRILAEAAALEVTGRMLRRAATGPREWAACVLDKEYGVFTATTRREAIDLAVEPALEDVASGFEGVGTVEVEVYEDPSWCEKAPQFCDEHEHDKFPRWLENQAGVTIEVEVYYLDPDDEDSNLDWREVTE